jgi:valyl-tRNA synthetase
MNITVFLTHDTIHEWTISTAQLDRLRAIDGATVRHCTTLDEFRKALPDTEIALTWVFRQAWFAEAPRLRLLSTPSAGHERVPVTPPDNVQLRYGSFHGAIISQTVLSWLLGWARGTLPCASGVQEFRSSEVQESRRPVVPSSQIVPQLLTDDDRHLLLRCDTTVRDMTDHLEKYRFQDAARLIQDFIWTEICDYYLETIKPDLASDNLPRQQQIFNILNHVLSNALRLLHPLMPFITEELWHGLGFATKVAGASCSQVNDKNTIMFAPWPTPLPHDLRAAWGLSQDICDFTDAKRELVTAARALRATYNLPPGQQLRYILHAQDAEKILPHLDTLKLQLRASELLLVVEPPSQPMPATLCKLGAIMLPLEGLIDVAAERARVDAEIQKNQGFLNGIDAKLNNPGFVDKAPAAVVENQRQRQAELRGILTELATRRAALG